MQVEIRYQPSYSFALVTLDAGESIQTESGAMVGMSPGLQLQTAAQGGFLKSLGRSLLGGESFFLNTYSAQKQGDSVALAPALPGDIAVIEMNGQELLVQSGSYLAASAGVQVDTKWSGAKTFFGGEGLFILKATGAGDVLFGSFGAIHEVDVNGSYTVDTGHIVAFESGLTFNVRRVGGIKSLFLSGEGLVCEFSGRGKLFIQTRKPSSFVHWIHHFRRVKPKSSS